MRSLMKASTILMLCGILLPGLLFAQASGDYRSAASGNWNAIATWQQFNGTGWVSAVAVPSSSDGLITIISGHTVTVNAPVTTDQTIVNPGGILTVSSTLTLNDGAGTDLSIQGTLNHSATIDGTGFASVTGIMNWTDGAISINLTITSTGTLSLTTFGSKIINGSKTLINQGTMNRAGGQLQFNNGTLQNEGILNESADNIYLFSGGVNHFYNTSSGIINKNGVFTTQVSIALTNNGTININNGVLILSTVLDHTGIINVNTGSTLRTSSFINNGSINVTSATIVSQVTFTQNNIMTYSGNCTVNNEGIWNVNVAQTLSAQVILNHTGFLAGSGSLLVDGTMNWTLGSISLNVTIGSTGVLTKSGFNATTISGSKTLINQGTFNWTGGHLNFNNGTLQNENAMNLTVNTINTHFVQIAGTNHFINTGTGIYTKSGNLDSRIEIPATNAGTINIDDGEIEFANATSNSGTIYTVSGSGLENTGTFNNNGTINVVVGAGFRNYGNLTINGTLNILGTVNSVAGSTINQNNFINYAGSPVINNSGTWNVNVAQTFNSPMSIQLSGKFAGSGSLNINCPITLISGSISLPLTLNTGITLSMMGVTNWISEGGILLNQGSINWTAGNLNFNNGTLQNEGSINQSVNAGFIHVGGTNLFNNTSSGTLTKSGTGTTQINVPVINDGLISGVGTLNPTTTFTNFGTISPGLSPGILILNGTQPFSSLSVLNIEMMSGTGPGTGHDQIQRVGNLVLNGTINISETGTVPSGTYEIIRLTSGTISGNFPFMNLPDGYSLQVNTNNVTVTKAWPLPLTLISFTAKKGTTHRSVLLDWKTAHEVDVSYIELQRSRDGIIFSALKNFPPHNNSMGAQYNWTDLDPLAGMNYYRLRIVDLDSTFSYSPIRNIRMEEQALVQVFPTITPNLVFLRTSKTISVDLFNSKGVKLGSKNISGEGSVDLSNFKGGVYIIRVIGTDQVVKIIKQ